MSQTSQSPRPPARRRVRTEGFRAAGAPGLTALMVVALTAGMLALAGTTPKGVGTPVGEIAQVDLEQRIFVCDAGLDASTVRRGSTVAGPEAAPTGEKPFVLDVGRARAETAYAAQQASTRLWSAWLPCPEPRARWWFTGAGASVVHDTKLIVTNPRPGAAIVDLDVFGADGPVDAPGLHGQTIPGGENATFDLARVAPAAGDLAIRVIAKRGLVTVAATDTYSPGSIGKSVREWLPATAQPATSTTLTGMPTRVDAAALVVANPGDQEAIVKVQVIGTRGTFAPKGIEPVTIGPESVATMPLSSVFDGTALAIKVTSEQPVAASLRVNESGDIAYATGVGPIRDTTAVAVPGGGRGQLVLSSIGEAGLVTVTGYDARGKQVLRKKVAVAAQTSVAVVLSTKVTALRLEAAAPTTVGGLVVVTRRTVAAAGIDSAARSIKLPVVRPGW